MSEVRSEVIPNESGSTADTYDPKTPLESNGYGDNVESESNEMSPSHIRTVGLSGFLANLGFMISDKARDTDDLLSFEQEVKILSSIAVRTVPEYLKSNSLNMLGGVIQCLRRALTLASGNASYRSGLFAMLGILLFSRFEKLGNRLDIDEAIQYHTQALELSSTSNSTERPFYLMNLASSYLKRFERLDDLSDINKAIESYVHAIHLVSDDHPDRPSYLNSLGFAYLNRFKRIGDLADNNKATECFTQAIDLILRGHPDSSLGSSRLVGPAEAGNLKDTDKMVNYFAHTTHWMLAGSTPNQQYRLSNLGNSWLNRFIRLGDITDLDKAIECYSRAVQLVPDGHQNKPGCLSNLGSAWSSRYEALGDLTDIDKAVDCLARAVQLTSENDPYRPDRLSNLGATLSCRFRRLRSLNDLDKAIEVQKQAVQLVSDTNQSKPTYLNSLGVSCSYRSRQLGNQADIDEALGYLEHAVDLTADDHPQKPGRLTNLGITWSIRSEHLSDLAAADKAVMCFTQAVELTPDGHTMKPAQLIGLVMALINRFYLSRQPEDLESAHYYIRYCATQCRTNPGAQFHCTKLWAKLAFLLSKSPLEAYQTAYTLLPRLMWVGHTIQRRYTIVQQVRDLTSEAVAWAITIGSYDTALEWLEQGCSIVWNQILQLRDPFSEVTIADPELAIQLKEVASKLDAASSRSTEHEYDLNLNQDLEAEAQRHRRLAAEWDELLTKARQLPSLDKFMLPRQSQELKRVTTDGPVVIINTHEARCDALIIFPQDEKITHVPLGTTSTQKLNKIRAQILSFVGQRQGGNTHRSVKYYDTDTCPTDPLQPLADLWSDIVSPVLNALGFTDHSSLGDIPHVTWCATGPLAALPLHAAGLYDGVSPVAFDLVVSSYTPTLSALLSQTDQAVGPHAGLLAIGQATTHGQPSLPKTVDELDIIRKYASITEYSQLDGALATIDATLDAMDKHSWVHLACHAIQDPLNPGHSAFYLHDGVLTLEDIAKRAFKDKGLAFLSTCQTATGDHGIPDEATHLAAGMLTAGYPSVIATIWSIMDDDAPEIAEVVYAELMGNGVMDSTGTARALHKAMGKLRQKVGVKAIGRWAPFVHIGR